MQFALCQIGDVAHHAIDGITHRAKRHIACMAKESSNLSGGMTMIYVESLPPTTRTISIAYSATTSLIR